MTVKNGNYISRNAKISKNVTFESPIRLNGTTSIQSNCTVKAFTVIDMQTTVAPKTTIGRFCTIGKWCEIGAIAHPVAWLSSSPIQYNMAYHYAEYSEKFPKLDFKRPMETYIGNDVLIDSLSLILRGVNIGDGAIVKARSVVTKDIPPYAIVEGIPAKIIGYRFKKDTIKQLLKLQWWNMHYNELSKLQFNDIHLAIKQLKIAKKGRNYGK